MIYSSTPVKSGSVPVERRIRKYTDEKIDVTYDAVRCIHAEECIKRLHAVFDTTKRPWVQPDAGLADNVAMTILQCPSGALHYERKDDEDEAVEPIPTHNTIRLSMNGPLYLRGDFTIVNGVGDLMVNDTRAALCRCGGSANKPFCDNTHKKTALLHQILSLNRKQSPKPWTVANYISKPRPMAHCVSLGILRC
jgi:uncharacterized Fe-S cluster protein YjdI/CDGSH-type Zn-finger protein